MNIVDQVEGIHVKLAADENYRRYLQAVYSREAVNGSLAADNEAAANMIRDKAKEIGSPVGDELLSDIVDALVVVLRRYDTKRRSLSYGD